MMPNLFNDYIYSYVSAWLVVITISISCVFFAGVGLTPGDLYFPAHIFAVQNAFNLVFFAYLFICLAFFFSSSSNKYTVGSIMMFVITILMDLFIIVTSLLMRNVSVITINIQILKIIQVQMRMIVVRLK